MILTQNVTAEPNETALVVPAGGPVTIDLAGNAIDRGLGSAASIIEDGNVITVNGSLTVTDSGTTASGTYVDSVTGNTVSVSGGVITGGFNETGGGIYVDGGILIMNAGSVCGNAGVDGGGIYVDGGTLAMSGSASVCGNASVSGGGIYVADGSSFTISGTAAVSGNKATDASGGGIYVAAGSSTLAMSGSASVSGNAADGGGGVYFAGTEFTMSESASITGNVEYSASEEHGGGGVYLGAGTFNMSGGTIGGTDTGSANSAKYGSGVFITGGTFAMSGTASVTGNVWENASGYSYGGGVNMTGGTFEMSGGTISGNSAHDGGAVYFKDGTFNMTGGTIGGSGTNDANIAQRGSGIYMGNTTAAFTMSGGSITGNTVDPAYNLSGGIHVEGGTVSLSGDPVISGNKRGTNKGDIYLGSGKKIIVSGELTGDDSSIGILLYRDAASQKVFTNSSDTSLNNADKFFSDEPDYLVGKKPDSGSNAGQLFLGAPVDLTYNAGNGGTGDDVTETHAAGSSVALKSAEELGFSGETPLAGWEDGSGNYYSAGSSFTIGSDAVTLSAQWAAASVDAGTGTVYYTSLKDALNAAASGDTVTVLRDITDESDSDVNCGDTCRKNIIIDMNGKTAELTRIDIQGNLTVMGGGILTAAIANTDYDENELLVYGAELVCPGTKNMETDPVTVNYGLQWPSGKIILGVQNADESVTPGYLTVSKGAYILGGSDNFTLEILGEDSSFTLDETLIGAHNENHVQKELQQYAPGGEIVVVDLKTLNTMVLKNRPKYTVTYTYDTTDSTISGTVPADPDSPYKPGDTVTVLGNVGTTPLTKTGSGFAGWTTTDAAVSNGKFTMPEKNVTLTAAWAPAVASVTREEETEPYAYFADLQLAFDSAESHEKVTLLTDVSTAPLTVSKYVWLDMDGFVIAADGTGSALTISGGVYLIDSTPGREHTGTYASLPAGGVITGGSGVDGGGVHIGLAGYFEMRAGTITGNSAGGNGGGVYAGSGEFTDEYGTGFATSHFIMKGGAVTGNTAVGNGGGVFTDEGCIFDMSGGSVSNNTASGNGSGVYISSVNSFYVTGAVEIDGNKKDGNNSNVYLPSGVLIYLDSYSGALSGDAKIGVTMADGSGVITSGLNGLSDTSALGGTANFASDNSAYAVGLNNAGEAILGYGLSYDKGDAAESDTLSTAVPSDPRGAYAKNDTVTVLGTDGQLYKTASDGTVSVFTYQAGQTFSMPAQSSTLHAQWAPAAASLKVGSADTTYYASLHEALAAAAAASGTGTKTVTLLAEINPDTENCKRVRHRHCHRWRRGDDHRQR